MLSLEQFIAAQIETVDHLRVLLLLQGTPQTSWTAVEVGGKLYQPELVASSVLAELAARGLLSVDRQSTRYRFLPQTPELAKRIEELAALDRERPVTLLNLIQTRPKDSPARAESFEIGKENRD